MWATSFKRFVFLVICIGTMAMSCGFLDGSSPADGKKTYLKYCKICHGKDGKRGFSDAADLSVSKQTKEELIETITNGKGAMNPYGEVLESSDIEALSVYVLELRRND